MDSPSHGYYFGLYEVGEFSIDPNSKIKKLKSYKFSYGAVGHLVDGKMFISLRESETLNGSHHYFLVKLNWEENPPQIEWKKPIKNSIHSIMNVKNDLLLGMRDGTVEIWNSETEKYERTINVLSDGSCIFEVSDDIIYVFGGKGEVAALTQDYNIIWKNHLSPTTIRGLIEYKRELHIIDNFGTYFLLNKETGSVGHSIKNYHKTYSNILIDHQRNWLITAGVNGLGGFWFEKKSIQYNTPYEDPLFRIIRPIPSGYITGDDTGSLKLWKYGKLTVYLD